MAQAVAGLTATYGIATGAFVDERDDWPRAIERARVEGWRWLELTAVRGRLDSLLRCLDADKSALDGFERVSVHAPSVMQQTPGEVVAMLVPLSFDIVLHPDVYGSEPSCADLGARALFENMDVSKAAGRTVRDLEAVFVTFPDAAFCLDVAHVWTNDTTLGLGHDLLDAFGDRLRQLHVSGIEPDGSHRPTTAADIARFAALLERCRDVPWLLETELVGETG